MFLKIFNVPETEDLLLDNDIDLDANIINDIKFSKLVSPYYCFIHQPHKMVKRTQKIRRQQLLSMFEHFLGLALKGLKSRDIEKLF